MTGIPRSSISAMLDISSAHILNHLSNVRHLNRRERSAFVPTLHRPRKSMRCDHLLPPRSNPTLPPKDTLLMSPISGISHIPYSMLILYTFASI
jgi:hypothetical protein